MIPNFKYFTTPIYYANGTPHAGHVYATILASILKYHYSQRKMQVKFLTGLDEHGEAVQDKAKELGKTPKQLVDEMAVIWKNEFEKFGLNNDIFIRTTENDHIKNVQDILQYCYDKGDIYFGEHEGYYCIKCEGFLNSNERDENNCCLVHKKPTELRKEKNYFFKTSTYREKLRELISQGHITHQEKYINELLGMLDNLDSDLSISRPKSRLTWGVELPFDKEHVSYVWFDALPNYVTGIGGLNAARTSDFWKNAHHILGKDILKFHGIFWPAMCLSLEIPLPKLLITGWILQNNQKMSKSLGNGIQVEQILHFGRDMFVNYFYRVTNPGEDIEFSWRSYFERYNSDLANGFGNLLSRTLTMIEKYFDNKIPKFYNEFFSEDDIAIVQSCINSIQKVKDNFDEFKIADALNETSHIVSLADKLIAKQKPWELAKQNTEESKAKLSNVIAMSVALLKTSAYLAYPFFPTKMTTLLKSIGENADNLSFEDISHFYNIKSDFVLNEIPKLFSRIDISQEIKNLEKESEQTQPLKENPKLKKDEAAAETSSISIQDFSKVEMRVGTVISAEHVDGSQKLLRLIVSLGSLGEKQIFSGIREWVKPEEIANRKVIIVSNLAPRKMKFGMSEGMMLATDTTEGTVCPIYLPENLKEGSLLT